MTLNSQIRMDQILTEFKGFYQLFLDGKVIFPDDYSENDKIEFKSGMDSCARTIQDFYRFLQDNKNLIDEVLDQYISEKLDSLSVYHIRKLKFGKDGKFIYGDKWIPTNVMGWLDEYKIFASNFISQKMSAKKMIDDEVSVLRSKIENYTAAQIFEGNLEAYNIYNTSSKNNFNLAIFFELLFIAVLIGAGIFTYASFEKYQSLETLMNTQSIIFFIVSKIFMTGIVVALCTYFIKRSSQHRKMAQIEQSTALELKAMGPYLKGVSDEKIEEVKLSLISKYFGVTRVENEDFHINEALLNNLKAASEILKASSEAAKSVADVAKK
ncbi:hypothetical protein [Acinetobacter sp. PK01]|uniref:hypothetical protein n=1 Tax=Acinetobacter sp. PK01 TaxID=2930198 RepID=UPI001FB854EB|nr:hypothetical protein [Acinetobacter sp. PK01]UOG18660.1 hypothetical protein MP622_03350 [Acinetobacter sp. PK01]